MFHKLEKKYRLNPRIRNNLSIVTRKFSTRCCLIIAITYSIFLSFYLLIYIENCNYNENSLSSLTNSIITPSYPYNINNNNNNQYIDSNNKYKYSLTNNLWQLFQGNDNKYKYPQSWIVFNSPNNRTINEYNSKDIITQSHPLSNYHLTSYFNYSNTDQNRILPITSVYSYLPDNVHIPTKEMMCRISGLFCFFFICYLLDDV